MFTTEQMQHLIDDGGVVVDREGDKVGKISEVYLDDDSGRPEWVTAKTGLFGGADTFVPLAGAEEGDNEVRAAHDKATIKDAPRTEAADGHLSPEQEQELYRHYGLERRGSDDDVSSRRDGQDQDQDQDQVRTQDGGDQDRDADERRRRNTRDHGDRVVADRDATDRDGHDDQDGRDVEDGHGRDSRDDDAEEHGSMVRSEERLDVDKKRVQTGKARLRKYVVTENVTTTVPVEREEVRVERESIDPDDADNSTRPDGELGEDQQDVVLSEEQVTVNKETVPVEKVRVGTDTVTEDRQVTEEVRQEQVDSDVDTGDAGRDR
ncbi:MAG TPA: PRC and DUF2382 domain-containing protein [Ornithinimicrobium sp.]|uniref:PRC and DUF2382 domain-containing protein n=1 Tax=Ornithinimicrobium sp. TaxID=1977084 RepID=UPI002B4A87BB|nr:PRC and DUF2382 domain-containing protein [Ornithinimicrobium sp.]HKJ12259.1 PRC and DUF2382 domain-containing protein [Ornithinimicrobium sp.]